LQGLKLTKQIWHKQVFVFIKLGFKYSSSILGLSFSTVEIIENKKTISLSAPVFA
jgi:hypothetical protein